MFSSFFIRDNSKKFVIKFVFIRGKNTAATI